MFIMLSVMTSIVMNVFLQFPTATRALWEQRQHLPLWILIPTVLPSLLPLLLPLTVTGGGGPLLPATGGLKLQETEAQVP